MIYLDNAATTRPYESVVEKMLEYYRVDYFNPSALYAPAAKIQRDVESAREYICAALGGSGKLYFTSCATESNTWAYTSGIKNKKGNVVVSMGEHASGYENAQNLISKGLDVRYVKLDRDGRIDESDFLNKVDPDTTFISVIHCGNETGAVNDIRSLADKAKKISKNVIFHSDGVQAFGKLNVNCAKMNVDLYSISAHKIAGPKGMAALWVRDGIRLNSLLRGGGQEGGMRSGTENVAGIMGFKQALCEQMKIDRETIAELRAKAVRVLSAREDVEINEAAEQSPFILSFSAKGIKSEVLQRKLCERGILVGLGSACSSKLKKNRVLDAMGRTMSHIEGSVRISFGACNLSDDIESAIKVVCECIDGLRL